MEKWGYKGVESALSGLLQWIYSHAELSGSANQRFDAACKIVIKYGEDKIPGYKKYGHLAIAAEFVAKKIKRNNKFQDFVSWYNQTNKPPNQ